MCLSCIDDSQVPWERFHAKCMQKSSLITGYPSYFANKLILGDFKVHYGAGMMQILRGRYVYCVTMMVRCLSWLINGYPLYLSLLPGSFQVL